MARKDPKLLLQTAPFLKRGVSTPRLMVDVILAMAPTVVAGVWYFGLSALLVMIFATAGAMITEAAFGKTETLRDGSAALTGLILALTLPPALPLWMAFLGGAVAVGMGKLVWGGLGHNLFNPALVGRAFLQAAFPTALTTWSAPSRSFAELLRLKGSTLAAPLMSSGVDVVTTASPLARMKFEHQATALLSLMLGRTAGCIGETSGLLIIAGGLYMAARRAFDWRIPVSILLTVAVFSGILHAVSPASYPTPWFMVFSGGLLFGAVFMATDPVTSPLAPKGAWLFGLGIGVLVVLIRLFGGLPEGVMYGILLMNATTPLIERVTQPKPFGRKGTK